MLLEPATVSCHVLARATASRAPLRLRARKARHERGVRCRAMRAHTSRNRRTLSGLAAALLFSACGSPAEHPAATPPTAQAAAAPTPAVPVDELRFSPGPEGGPMTYEVTFRFVPEP